MDENLPEDWEDIVEVLREREKLSEDWHSGLAANEIERLRAKLSYGWIPVADRLPPLLTEVLGWHRDDCVRAWFRHSGQPKDAPYWELWSPQDRECDDCDVDEPSHWMPLPKPPDA